MVVRAPSLDEHFAAAGPKRILALDGGGVRGILSLGFLQRMEEILRERHGNDPAFRLSDYFDLIAGTSTGSIIAALLAKGWVVADVIALYLQLAEQVFSTHWWDPRGGILRPRYRPRDLSRLLRNVLGAEVTMGDPLQLRTGLLVMCKRIDTGSPWPISNNPKGHYFLSTPGEGTIANRDYKLWQVVRASTAAPTFFQPEAITIATPQQTGQDPVRGRFIDGGVSPHNNPALQAYWLATLEGFGLRWSTGQERLLIHSVGTGRIPVDREPGWLAAMQGVTALSGLMDDCATLVESLMQGMGHCLSKPRQIDPEIRNLSPHELVDKPRFSYARYDVKLFHDPESRDEQDDEPHLRKLGLSTEQLAQMRKMDNPQAKHLLLELGHTAAAEKVLADHFPAAFDLPGAPGRQEPSAPLTAPSQMAPTPPSAQQTPPASADSPRLATPIKPYRKRDGTEVTAIRVNLDVETFTYHKWGGLQTCKGGDWIVDRDGNVHTVDADSFARTYKQVGPARYRKEGVVWAAQASGDGAIGTKEGKTQYKHGDFLVWNDKACTDGYAIGQDLFDSLYEPASSPPEDD